METQNQLPSDRELIAHLRTISNQLGCLIRLTRSRGTGLLNPVDCENELSESYSSQYQRFGTWVGEVAAIELMKDDPRRIGFIISNTGGGPFAVGTTSAVILGTGINLAIGEMRLELWQAQSGLLVQKSWFGVGGVPATSGSILESFCGLPGRPGDAVVPVL